MRHRPALLFLLASLAFTATARADEPSWPDLERSFCTLPMEARRLTGPLYWLHGDETSAQLVGELEKVAEGGNGNFTAESRPHVDWLGPTWYRDLQTCLDAARRLNLQMWIFDEKWWPSGEVGGKTPQQFGAKKLYVAGFHKVGGPFHVDLDLHIPPDQKDRLVAVLAGHEAGENCIDPDSIIDLTDHVKDGKLVWDSTAANWRILPLMWQYSKARGDRILVDGASQAAVDWYIDTVYKPHHDRFGADFGKTIPGFFYDEPETPGDFGTELIPELKARGVDWKKALVAWSVGLSDPDQDLAYKYQYRLAFAEAWGRTLYGGLTRWCNDRNVKSIGHFLEHNHEYLKDEYCAGDMMQLQKYSDMGAIDAVFKQFIPGKKDSHTYQTPKLGSSISHAYGKADDVTMVEIFGARGQDLSYPEMKWWTDLMHVAGVNFHIPHSFNPRAPYDTDCPPYFYHGGYEPRWPLYRVYADYTSRLSLLLTGGRHVAPVALLYAGQGYHFEPAITPEDMTTALQDALYDCDWLPYDAFEADTKLDGRDLALRQERYRVLVVPAVTAMPPSVLAKVRAFFEAGGTVIGYGHLPARSTTPGVSGAELTVHREAIWGASAVQPSLEVKKTNAAGGRSYFLPEKPTAAQVQQVLAADARILPTLEVVEGDTGDWLHVLHRVKSGRDIFFIANQNHQGDARRFRLRFHAAGVPEAWDALRNEVSPLPGSRQGEAYEAELTLEPLQSLVVVFRPETEPTQVTTPSATREVLRLPLDRQPSPPSPSSRPPDRTSALAARLAGCSWVWYPEQANPAVAAPPGTRYFRKVVEVPADRPLRSATMIVAADNDFLLTINGRKAGASGGGAGDWTRPAELDVAPLLRPGPNALAFAVTNASDRPNPAGLLGALDLLDESGQRRPVPIDATWSSSSQPTPGWTDPGFAEPEAWRPARTIAKLGDAPWGNLAGQGPTLSPIDRADPFLGVATLPAGLELQGRRIDLVLDRLAPEEAARITVNGHDAGGFIGRPLRLDVARWLQPGRNEIRIEPFAPTRADLVVYGAAPGGQPETGR